MRLDRRAFLSWLWCALGAVALPRRTGAQSAPPGAVAVHRATRNTRLGALGARLPKFKRPPAPYKAYSGMKRVKLPHPRLVRSATLSEALGSTATEADALTFEEIGRLLFLTNGVTGRAGRKRLRAAPSAGALYSNEVYLWAERVQGVPAGAYYYDVLRDALVPLRTGSQTRAFPAALEPAALAETTPAFVLLSNVFERYTWRYANRGYRYALIDSGHVAENLRLASSASGLASLRVDRFADDALHALLDLDGQREAICAVIALGAPRIPATSSRLVETGAAPVGLRSFERYHQATKLTVVGEESALEPPSPAGPLLVAEPPAARLSLDAAIAQRRSATRLDARAMERAQLEFLLTTAAGPARTLEVLTSVHRVRDVEAGLYRYEDGALVSVRRGEFGTALRRASLNQRKAEEAGAAFLILGDVESASARRGERAYRHLLLDAGAIAQRLYLAAETLGLAARNLAAFTDDDLNALVGFDGRRRAVLHLTVVGHGA